MLMIVLAAVCAALIPFTPDELRAVPIVSGLAAGAWAVVLSVRDLRRGRSRPDDVPDTFAELSLDDALTMLRPPSPPRHDSDRRPPDFTG